MQSEFAELLGKPHGLERGIEHKRSNHQTLKQFYGALEQENIKTPSFSPEDVQPQISEKGWFSTTMEGNDRIAARLTQSMNEYYAPIAKLAAITLKERQERKKSQYAMISLQKRLNALEANFEGLNSNQKQQVIQLAQQFQQENKMAKQLKSTLKKNRSID